MLILKDNSWTWLTLCHDGCFQRCFDTANYIQTQGVLIVLGGFGKDLSCLLPYAPVNINFCENENGLSVTWKPLQGNIPKEMFIAGHSSVVWNNILITIGGVQQNNDKLPTKKRIYVFF